MKEPISQARRRTRDSGYDPQPFIARLNELLKKNKESYREAALSSGLDHQAVRRILAGQQPSMTNCILLADHFRISPNEFLSLAGWPTLKAFETQPINQEQLPPEVVEVALALAKIANPGVRKDVATSFLTLVNKCINPSK
jgi:hypothetical protein